MKKSNGFDPLRVFVGTSPSGEDAEACMVFERSLRSRASVPLEVTWLRLSPDETSPCYSRAGAGWRTELWSTPWTALRWAVPEICGWRGRAVYFDCPTIVLGDVAELGRAPFPRGAFALLRWTGTALGTACAVFDCAEAKKHLQLVEVMRADPGAHQAVGVLLERHPKLVGPLPGDWGSIDAEVALRPARAPLGGSVHFPSPYTQPHAARALARLSRGGRAHWHDGVRLPHYCARLVDLFE
ncbi:MAG: glycosyl transferase, partial [Dehalococcoidia bacterium]|nr:glycosyl transferase [Dehalococcoidia bacterium]